MSNFRNGKNKKVSGIAPLQPPALASFRTWGIQQELVVPLDTKLGKTFLIAKGIRVIGVK